MARKKLETDETVDGTEEETVEVTAEKPKEVKKKVQKEEPVKKSYNCRISVESPLRSINLGPVQFCDYTYRVGPDGVQMMGPFPGNDVELTDKEVEQIYKAMDKKKFPNNRSKFGDLAGQPLSTKPEWFVLTDTQGKSSVIDEQARLKVRMHEKLAKVSEQYIDELQKSVPNQIVLKDLKAQVQRLRNEISGM